MTSSIDRGDRAEFTARYFVESPDPLEKVAEIIAGEQSSGSFVELPGETGELKQRARARVTRIEAQAPALEPSLHSSVVERRRQGGPYHRGEIEIAFPVDNVGTNLPTLLATVAGNLYELGELTGIRLLDVDLPQPYAQRFPGPRFGVAGTRAKAGVHAGPIIGTIIKPSIGLSAEQTASLVDALLAGGIDFVKDDELTADPAHAPFDQRLAAVMPVLHRHADRLGRMPMYAINISGTVDEMRRRHDEVLRAGGTCVMVSINWVGFSGVHTCARRASSRSMDTATAGAHCRAIRRWAWAFAPTRSCGAWRAWTSFTWAACAASSRNRTPPWSRPRTPASHLSADSPL